MTKKSAEILEIRSSKASPPNYSQSFKSVMKRWGEISVELDTLIEEDQKSISSEVNRHQIESRYEKAGEEQRDLFNAATKLHANKIEDVLAKLELWKAVTCPDDYAPDQLSITEEILLSAYYDMTRLVSHSEDN